MERNSAFWAIWAARPVLKNSAILTKYATFEGDFFTRVGKMLILAVTYTFLGQIGLSNLNVLNKGLFIQDWVFRLGQKCIKYRIGQK